MEKIMGDLLDRLQMTNKLITLSREFGKLESDEERVIFTLKVMKKYEIIPEINLDTPKNNQEATKLRMEGNKIFTSTDLNDEKCLEAYKLYTKSIAFAHPDSGELAFAYSNRSAVLLRMRKFKECIRDIDRILDLKFLNDNIKAKLYIRKAECSSAMEDTFFAENYEKATQWLEKLTIKDETYKNLKTKLNNVCQTSKSVEDMDEKMDVHPTINENHKNKEIACASDAVRIEYDEQFGRHVVASRKINPGEIIAIEKPYLRLLSPKNLETHCAHCLRVSWGTVPCDYCTQALYCSKECQNSAWVDWHAVECRVFHAMLKPQFTKLDMLTLRMTIKALREFDSTDDLKKELKEVDECNDLRTKGFDRDGIFQSDKYRSFYSLVTNTEKRSTSDLFRRSIDACFILYFLATLTTLFGESSNGDLIELAKNKDVTFVGSLLLRHQQTVPCNMHSVGELRGLEISERGIGAFAFLSLFNHSCESNVIRHSREDREVLCVLYPIEKNEQLFENYGYHYALMTKTERQLGISKQYQFRCECLPCKQDWPTYMKVPRYTQLIHEPEGLRHLDGLHKKFGKYYILAITGVIPNTAQVLKELFQIIEDFSKYVSRPCIEMNDIVETLKHIYDLSGNRFIVPKINLSY